MLAELDHPFARGEPVYDVTFENVQAGLRTDYLFRIANQRGGIVLGTGDLSELALGWSTYGVGDQMSHYNVNGGVPEDADPAPDPLGGVAAASSTTRSDAVLTDVLDTEITPELVPDRRGRGGAEQRGEGRARTRCRTSPCSTCCATASGRRRSRSWPGTPGTTRTAATGRPGSPPDERPALLAGRDPALAGGLRAAVLRLQPVQALGPAQRPEGLGRRVAVPARRLAGAIGHVGPDLARRRAHRPGTVGRRAAGCCATTVGCTPHDRGRTRCRLPDGLGILGRQEIVVPRSPP